MRRRDLRPASGLLGLLLVGLCWPSCAPTRRESHEIRLGVTQARLTNAAPTVVVQRGLSDDPFYVEHQDDLDQIGDLRLQISVSENRSTRLRIGVYVSADQLSDVNQATKIADFNLAVGDLTPPGGADVRLFNETILRNLLRGDVFYLYVSGQADTLDVTISEASLLVDAKFVQ
jgi:hypothetical protein